MPALNIFNLEKEKWEYQECSHQKLDAIVLAQVYEITSKNLDFKAFFKKSFRDKE